MDKVDISPMTGLASMTAGDIGTKTGWSSEQPSSNEASSRV